MKHKLEEFSLEQKIKLVMGADFWTNYDAEGKLYKFTVSDGPVGLRKPADRTVAEQKRSTIPSIAYPSTQMLSHTWDRNLAYKMGHALGNDCIDLGVDILLAPGVNIKRLPQNGRNFEYVSEDPYLAGTMAREYINGVQSKHVGTSLKHFCCNNLEYSRKWASMEVDERTLREIYLRPFQIACEAKPWTVMCSYNLVNGVRMSENETLYGVLRNEFGFDGLIMSDWEAVKNPINSVNACCNWEMPYDKAHQEKLLEVVKTGAINIDKLNESVTRVVELSEKCEEESKLRKVDMTKEERRALAQEIAENGIVLLKNDDNVLPMKGGKVLVTGAPSFKYYYGGGSSAVIPEEQFTPVCDALKNEGVDAVWHESIWEVCHNEAHVGDVGGAIKIATLSDYTVLCVGESESSETEAYDRETIRLTAEEGLVIHDLARVSEKLIVVVYAGSVIDMSDWIDEVDAVVWAGYGGQRGNNALARVLTGKVNPCGKLTETFPLSVKDVPSVNSYRDSVCMVYEEGLNVGYRYFDSFGEEVLFPFGYGLSYSEFEYSNLEVRKDGELVHVAFDIENVSDIDGKEIAQIYVGEITRKVYRPLKELKAYEKVCLKAHEKKRVEVTLDKHAFEYWNVSRKAWHVDNGVFEISIGKNVDEIVLNKKIEY